MQTGFYKYHWWQQTVPGQIRQNNLVRDKINLQKNDEESADQKQYYNGLLQSNCRGNDLQIFLLSAFEICKTLNTEEVIRVFIHTKEVITNKRYRKNISIIWYFYKSFNLMLCWPSLKKLNTYWHMLAGLSY